MGISLSENEARYNYKPYRQESQIIDQNSLVISTSTDIVLRSIVEKLGS